MECYTEETDNTTKNIVHEIVRECAALDLKINPNFCTFYVKLLTLDPEWHISPERKINRENIQLLVSFIIEKMKLVNSPSIATMKMQQYFLSHFLPNETMIVNQRRILKTSAEPLLENVISLPCTDTNKARISKRLALYIALMMDLGNAKNSSVIKEIATALRSIVDEEYDFIKFGKMKPEEKITYIENLQNIVFGIRLFNRDSGRHIAEIDDMPKLLPPALLALVTDLNSTLQEITKNIDITKRIIEELFYLSSVCKQRKTGSHEVIAQLNRIEVSSITDEAVNNLIEKMVLYRQYEIYIRLLISRLQKIEVSAKSLVNELTNVFQKLRGTIKYNIGIATNIVFPLLVELGSVWRKFQNEFIVLAQCAKIFSKLRQFMLDEPIENKFLELITVEKQESEEINESGKFLRTEFLCEWIKESDVKGPIDFEFSGFCVWTLIETYGGLVLGNPKLGILKWNKKYYAIAHSEAAYIFGKDPLRLILKAYSIIRKKPELIAVLKVHKDLFHYRDTSISDDYLPNEPKHKGLNKMNQTVLHAIPSYIDPNYVWNAWDYYRSACKLASVVGCQTHSVQTIKSNFRYAVPAQILEMREKSCQTKKKNYMNVATPSNFIFGLRGRKDNNQHVVDLTVPIYEDQYRTCATAMSFPPPCQTTVLPCYKSTLKENNESHGNIGKSQDFSSVSIHGESSGIEYLNLSSCLCVQALKHKQNII